MFTFQRVAQRANALEDHIVHQLLSAFALGASPDEIQQGYVRNASYQRPAMSADEDIVRKLSTKEGFKEFVGKREQYASFLKFFQRELESKGVEAVVQEHVFAGDGHADDMLYRLFGGKHRVFSSSATVSCLSNSC